MSQKKLDLSKLTITELENLLQTQKLLLSNQSLIATLRDKGDKITKFRDKIQEALVQAKLQHVHIAQSSYAPVGLLAQSPDIGINDLTSQMKSLTLVKDSTEFTVMKTTDLLVPYAKKQVSQADSMLKNPFRRTKYNEPLKKTYVSPTHSKSDSLHQHWEGILEPSHSGSTKQLSVLESIQVSKDKVLGKLQNQIDSQNRRTGSKFRAETSAVGISSSCGQGNITPSGLAATGATALKFIYKVEVDCESDAEDLSDDKISDSESEDGEESG